MPHARMQVASDRAMPYLVHEVRGELDRAASDERFERGFRMKGLKTAAFFVAITACNCARGGTIVSGSVFDQDLNGNTYMSSGVSSSSLSLAAGGPGLGSASLIANLGDTSGTLSVVLQSTMQQNPFNPSTLSTVSYDLSVDGIYMLTGGTGYGYADLTVSDGGVDDTGDPICSITFAGQTQGCAYGVITPFYVPYNTPLTLDLQASYTGAAFADGDENNLSYNFTDLTLVPEPSSLLLLGTGLITLFGATRRRRSLL